MRSFQAAFYSTLLLLALVPTADAQSLVGQISGTIVDQGGAFVPGATVVLTHDLSQQTRSFSTDPTGNFLFPGLLAGNYSVHVSKQGFKSYDQRAIALATQEKLDLHELRLEIGEVSTSVEVSAVAARVQTDSSDRISSISTSTVQDLPNPTRSFLAATRTVPGSQSTGNNGGGGINGFNGNTGQIVIQLDGIIQQDSGAPNVVGTAPGRLLVNIDAVSEIQVQASTVNAEFGSRAGGQVLVSTKSGTNQFHGSLYLYLRNEALNANTFFNNKNAVNGVAVIKPRSRFQNPGFTIGGPVLLPFLPFNRSRTKMFFFYAEDQVYNKSTGDSTFTMPTAREKIGDFSQTVTTRGALIPVTDPANSNRPFPNNVIPLARLDQTGVAMLNLFPTGCPWTGGTPGAMGAPSSFGLSVPCVVDPTGARAYNTRIFPARNTPTTTRTLRVDYSITPKTNMYTRLLQSLQTNEGVGVGQLEPGTAWGQFANTNPQNGRAFSTTLVHTFTPNLISEFTMGTNFVHQQNEPLDSAQFFKAGDLSNFKLANGSLVNPTQIFPGNYQNLIPNINFTANNPQTAGPNAYVSGRPTYGFDNRWPFDGTESTSNYSANLTWIRGRHSMKAGFNLEHGARNVSVYELYNPNGSYYFGTDTGNPLDSGYAISNMLLGSIQSYGQDNVKQINHARFYQYEWFVQDTWKVSRRLTLDYGMRFQIIPQTYSAGATLGLFNGSSYSGSKTGTLLFPSICTAAQASACPKGVGSIIALNPTTGKVYPGVHIGNFDPLSYSAGSFPYSGIDIYKDGRLFDTNHPQYGPRLGFAYDVFGDGKTAIRGGFGIFYQRAYGVDTIASGGFNRNNVGGPMKIPPYFQAPTFYNTTFAGLASATPLFGPQLFNGGSNHMPNPTTNSWSLGVQRDLGKGIVMDVSYVGNVFHHGQGTAYNANGIQPNTVWTPTGGTCNSIGNCTGSLVPRFIDPTKPTQALPINLVRSMIGYNGIADAPSFTSAGESNYNSLQVSINRRFGTRLNFTSNWTWQKTITFARNQYLSDQMTKNVANRKQAVNINLNYSIPSLTKFVGKNFLTEGVFDGWHVDGVMSFFSGNPLTVACQVPAGAPPGYPNGQDGVTNGLPFRCQNVGSLFLTPEQIAKGPVANGYDPSTDASRLWYPINQSSFVLPPLSTNGVGNTPLTMFWGPGFENVDASIYKSFRVKKETNQLQFRLDVTNLLNHFNPADPNLSLQYDFNTGVQRQNNFGQITAQATNYNSRAMSASVRFRF